MRGLLLLYAGVTACLFIVQGIYILKTRSVRGIFARFGNAPSQAAKPKVGMLMSCFTLYLGSGAALLALLAAGVISRHLMISLLLKRIVRLAPHLVGPFSLVAVGIWAVVDPSRALGWARGPYPEIAENDPFGLLLVRVIGAGRLAQTSFFEVCDLPKGPF